MARKPQLTPLTKGGSIKRHDGKGSESAPLPDRGQIGKLARGGGINDYAKATPLAKGFGPIMGGGTGGL